MTDETTETLPEIIETETPVVEAVETPEVAETTEETPETDGEEGDLHDDKRRGKTAQDRINDLTRARREAERERDFYKGLVSQPTPVSAPEVADKPTPDTFETYDDYVEALTDWKVSQTLTKQSSENAHRTEEMVRQANWASKLEAAQSTLPDFATVVGSSEVSISDHVAQALMDSDRGPELAYHMAQHPDLAERLNKLSPVKAAMELGRLESTIAAPVVKPHSKAPAPITPLSPGPTGKIDLAKADMATYMAERAKQGARFRV